MSDLAAAEFDEGRTGVAHRARSACEHRARVHARDPAVRLMTTAATNGYAARTCLTLSEAGNDRKPGVPAAPACAKAGGLSVKQRSSRHISRTASVGHSRSPTACVRVGAFARMRALQPAFDGANRDRLKAPPRHRSACDYWLFCIVDPWPEFGDKGRHPAARNRSKPPCVFPRPSPSASTADFYSSSSPIRSGRRASL